MYLLPFLNMNMEKLQSIFPLTHFDIISQEYYIPTTELKKRNYQVGLSYILMQQQARKPKYYVA